MTATAFDPLEIVGTLVAHEVRFVLIGGVALGIHGSPRVTNDTDISYERSRANLERLAGALRSLGARRIADLFPEGVDAEITADYLANEEIFAFMTEFGQLDLVAAPLGAGSFEELLRSSIEVDLSGTPVRVASLDALRDMKRARDWPVDRSDLELIREIERRQMDRSDSDG
ncbi:MAG: hypothetical protein ACRDKT_17095 [Actinomycetota bacterium]